METKRRKFGQLASKGMHIIFIAALFTVLLVVLVRIVTYEWLPACLLAKCFVSLVAVGTVVCIIFVYKEE